MKCTRCDGKGEFPTCAERDQAEMAKTQGFPEAVWCDACIDDTPEACNGYESDGHNRPYEN